MARYPQTILVSCEIPWDEDENLIEDVFRREIRSTLAQGFNHLYILGTAGEGYAVDTARFQEIVRIFYQETRGEDVHPMVGVIALSTANTVERIALAHDVGLRTFQIVLPGWGALNDSEVMTYLSDVCGAFPDSMFLHYNLPRARRVLEGTDYRRLIDAIPNLVATKTTSGGLSRAAGLMTHAPELQHFFGEENFAYGCMYGECSLLASLAMMVPGKTRAYFQAGRMRRVDQLFELQRGFHDLIADLFSSLPPGERIDGAYDKMIKRMGGLEMPLRLLSPYQCYTEEQYQACKQILNAKYSDWMAR